MKVPEVVNVHCPKCNAHTEHKVSLYKKGKERSLAIGARRHQRELRGYGGQKYPIQRNKAKTTDKKTMLLTCNKCGRKLLRAGVRLRKLEIVR
ncbi:MAG: 50S ribosomal protein L44e [Thaumarchaeota archaeon]|nr:50S ribosomal protein L44e [Candidatus Calditenuaceae archaeon]MDW8041459.1 50S ribosomal protein L44e [Nitrososphaerota archaeon]